MDDYEASIGDITISNIAQRNAAYNLAFVEFDASHGVHNAKYAIQLLQQVIPGTAAPPERSRGIGSCCSTSPARQRTVSPGCIVVGFCAFAGVQLRHRAIATGRLCAIFMSQRTGRPEGGDLRWIQGKGHEMFEQDDDDGITGDTPDTGAEEIAELLANERSEPAKPEPQPGEKVTGTIVQIGDTEAFVDCGGRAELPIALRELQNNKGEFNFAVGSTITAGSGSTARSSTCRSPVTRAGATPRRSRRPTVPACRCPER